MGTPQTPKDLERHPYLRFPWQAASGHALRGMRLSRLDGSQSAIEVGMQVVFQAESYETLFTAAISGAGVAALPRFPASIYFESGALVHLLPDWIFGRYTVYVALPTRKLMPARTRAFLDFASEMVPFADRRNPVR
jgi:DNA-binding transcriptional LysR family regulator